MTREFRAFEYVDGDLKVYAREKGQGDDAWREVDTVPFDKRRAPLPLQAWTIEQHMNTTLTEGEINQLLYELTWPRRL